MWAVGLLVLQTAGAIRIPAPAPNPSTEVMVQVSARQYRTDGRSSGMAADTGRDSTQGYVWTDAGLCTFGASSRETPTSPGFGWHYNAHVTAQEGDVFVVRVDWERVWDRSIRVATPHTASVDVKLRAGDEVELDHVLPAAASPCQSEIVRLEVAMVLHALPPASGSGSAGGGGAGGGRAGVSGGGAAARPVEPIVPATVAGATPTVQSDEDLRLQMMAMLRLLHARVERTRSSPPVAPARGDAAAVDASLAREVDALSGLLTRPRYDAEVWLVHRLPDGTEDVQRQAVRFASRASITYSPISIVTPHGTVRVDVTAVLQLQPGDAPRVDVRISRRIRSDGPPPLDNLGGSVQGIDVAKPGDVVSFEMPTLVGSASDLLAGHAFSLRVRVVPPAR